MESTGIKPASNVVDRQFTLEEAKVAEAKETQASEEEKKTSDTEESNCEVKPFQLIYEGDDYNKSIGRLKDKSAKLINRRTNDLKTHSEIITLLRGAPFVRKSSKCAEKVEAFNEAGIKDILEKTLLHDTNLKQK